MHLINKMSSKISVVIEQRWSESTNFNWENVLSTLTWVDGTAITTSANSESCGFNYLLSFQYFKMLHFQSRRFVCSNASKIDTMSTFSISINELPLEIIIFKLTLPTALGVYLQQLICTPSSFDHTFEKKGPRAKKPNRAGAECVWRIFANWQHGQAAILSLFFAEALWKKSER